MDKSRRKLILQGLRPSERVHLLQLFSHSTSEAPPGSAGKSALYFEEPEKPPNPVNLLLSKRTEKRKACPGHLPPWGCLGQSCFLSLLPAAHTQRLHAHVTDDLWFASSEVWISHPWQLPWLSLVYWDKLEKKL